MKHAQARRFPVTIVVIAVLAVAAIVIGHNYLMHNGINVQWQKGRQLQPAPTAGCSSGWLWRPSTSTWVCEKP